MIKIPSTVDKEFVVTHLKSCKIYTIIDDNKEQQNQYFYYIPNYIRLKKFNMLKNVDVIIDLKPKEIKTNILFELDVTNNMFFVNGLIWDNINGSYSIISKTIKDWLKDTKYAKYTPDKGEHLNNLKKIRFIEK